MGNYRFRLSDMVPNAWFYKLKYMSTNSKNRSKSQTKKSQTSSSSLSASSSSIFSSKSSNLQQTKTQQQPHNNNLSCQRKSYYFSRNLSPKNNPTPNNINISEPPKKSSKKKRNTTRKSISPRFVNSTVSAGCNCRASLESVWTTPEDFPNSPFSSSSNFSSEQESSVHSPKIFDSMILSASCHCKIHNDMNENDHGFDSVDLPPILTKPKKLQDSTNCTKKRQEKSEHKSLTVKIVKKEQCTITSPKRRVSVSSSNGGVKLRTKSPRIVSRKSVSSSTNMLRTSVGESFAVVKSSKDPQRDFKESMVEMIVENNIRTSRDLEELLACYLSLNSDQYHDLIIKVFKQIWFDITDVQLK